MKYHFIEIMLEPSLTEEQCQMLFDEFKKGICAHEFGKTDAVIIKDMALITREEARLDGEE